jgi:hypothetical protein
MTTYYHGHLVYSQFRRGFAIAIVPSDDGMERLSACPNIEHLLTETLVCGKSFERQDDYLGTMFVCVADNRDQVEVGFEMHDLQETLENECGFLLRVVDERYCRLITPQIAA